MVDLSRYNSTAKYSLNVPDGYELVALHPDKIPPIPEDATLSSVHPPNFDAFEDTSLEIEILDGVAAKEAVGFGDISNSKEFVQEKPKPISIDGLDGIIILSKEGANRGLNLAISDGKGVIHMSTSSRCKPEVFDTYTKVYTSWHKN